MALVVEDGTGKTDADSYISRADADTYVAKYIKSDNAGRVAWEASTDDEKDDALRQAAQYLDQTYQTKWQGVRTHTDQALDWPRTGVVDCDDETIDSDAIPVDLKNAQAEMATRGTVEELFADVDSPVGDIKRRKEKVGPLEVDTEYVGGAVQQKQYTKPNQMLRCFLRRFGAGRMAERG
jgi:hypothetical protein